MSDLAARRREKAVILIDGGYLRAILKEFYQETPIDFLALSDELCGNCERFRTYYYICPPYQSSNPTPDERRRTSEMDKLLFNLRRLPRFEVRLGRLRRTGNPSHLFEQKGVDVLLSIDMTQLSASHTVDHLVLMSGDSDFVPAVRVAKDNMTLVKLVYQEGQTSDELFSICDDRMRITKDLIDKVRWTPSPAPQGI